MNVAIACPVLSDGDAIGHDVLGMALSLRAAGHEVRLHAEKSLIQEDVYTLEELYDGDLLIYHHSHGCEAGVRSVRNWPGRAVVKYHNVTPPRFFLNADPKVREAAEAGMEQARKLAKAFPFWVDSEFNADGLDCDCSELPPFMPTETLLNQLPDAEYAAQLDDWRTTLLCVGRVAPNKNIILAVESLAEYRKQDETARLIIAGGHVFPEYSEAVRERIDTLRLTDHVCITGRVTSSQLKALYLSADALLVTSDHEGFCVPLVEAMALGVPTVAVRTTAIPGTAGPFARYADSNATSVADAVLELVTDRSSRGNHLREGSLRYQERFHPQALRQRFLNEVDALMK